MADKQNFVSAMLGMSGGGGGGGGRGGRGGGDRGGRGGGRGGGPGGGGSGGGDIQGISPRDLKKLNDVLRMAKFTVSHR